MRPLVPPGERGEAMLTGPGPACGLCTLVWSVGKTNPAGFQLGPPVPRIWLEGRGRAHGVPGPSSASASGVGASAESIRPPVPLPPGRGWDKGRFFFGWSKGEQLSNPHLYKGNLFHVSRPTGRNESTNRKVNGQRSEGKSRYLGKKLTMAQASNPTDTERKGRLERTF